MNHAIEPPGLARPSGFAYAMECHGKLLFLSGATGQDASGRIRAKGDLVAQFEDAITNICRVVEAAGGSPQDVVKLTYFVRDRDEYLAKRKDIGEAYRRHFGKHYPAQSLFGITSLWEDDALIEIEAIACIGEAPSAPLPEETTIPGA
ncbi:MAG TPA: RidA family protein [Chloroflexota bacterium]